MDLSAASRDIHDLVASFADYDDMSFHHLKSLWTSRGFSFIHEACPKDTTQAFFMQSLYSSALGHVKSAESSLSWKVGGLFVLYCLYETQYVEPFYLIYLSLEDLESLHGLVKELKLISHKEGLKVVRTMLRKEAFLFGCVSVDQKSIADACEKLAKQAAARLKHARFRLLANVPLQEHVHGSLRQVLSLESVMGVLKDYGAAKKHVFTGLGVMETAEEEGGGIAEDLRKVVDGWEAQKRDLLSINGMEIQPLQVRHAQPKKRRRREDSQQPVAERTEEEILEEEILEEDMLAEEILGLIDME